MSFLLLFSELTMGERKRAGSCLIIDLLLDIFCVIDYLKVMSKESMNVFFWP